MDIAFNIHSHCAREKYGTVEFIEGDIFVIGFGQEHFDLITCFDSISDFPISDFAKLSERLPAL